MFSLPNLYFSQSFARNYLITTELLSKVLNKFAMLYVEYILMFLLKSGQLKIF